MTCMTNHQIYSDQRLIYIPQNKTVQNSLSLYIPEVLSESEWGFFSFLSNLFYSFEDKPIEKFYKGYEAES